MARKIEIPAFLSHLKVADNGYPIPYFVGYINGKPDFRILDPDHWVACIKYNKCAICGKKNDKWLYIISGPQGVANGASTDAPMHRHCAEYSLRVCPHMYYEKAERREVGLEHVAIPDHQDMSKPPVICLAMTKQVKLTPVPGQRGQYVLKYKAENIERYVYKDGLLEKE